MALADTSALQAPATATVSLRRWRVLRRILHKKIAVIALAYIILFYIVGIFAPVIAPYDPNDAPTPLRAELRNASPSADHLLGTDSLGRDILSRVMYACRITILFTLIVVLTGSFFVGLGLGLLAGYRGGWIDTGIMRTGEVLSAVPTLILILAVTAAFRTRINGMAFAVDDATPLSRDDAKTIVQFLLLVGVSIPFAWFGSARIVRSQVLSLRETQFVESAEAIGASTWRIITRHIFPGVVPLFMVGVTASMAGIALTEVAISFLGLGIQPPAASFGTLIGDGAGARAFEQHPHLLLSSAIPVVLFFLAWNLFGDALVDILEPRSTREA